MTFSKRFVVPLLTLPTFLTPVNTIQAQEKACVAATEVKDAGQIIWSKSPDVADLVGDAQKLEISPADYKELCSGEEVIDEASGEKPEEDKEKTEEDKEKTEQVASEETTAEEKVDVEKTTSAAESSGIGWAGAVLGGLAAAVGGGGGGGGGVVSDGTYRNTISGAFGTEYTYQSMLSSISPLSLNDYGYTGSGVKVAVVDSGIDKNHAEFDSKLIYGRDFASSASGYGFDENGHGSHVAAIIAGDRDGSGMRGVAYDATLYDYKTDNNGDATLEAITTDASIAAIFNQHVTDGIQVSNNSWGNNIKITNTTASAIRSAYPSTINAMRSAQSNGTLIIFAAGNNGWLQPNADAAAAHLITELANEWLVVVAVDSTLTETNYTNRCGVAYNICVTAPGGGDNAADGILSAQANGTYVRSSGTSMAAPHVSGLAAALMEKFPSLTAAQIATRIKSTASYNTLTGSSGQTSANSSAATMQAIFGHGLVNSGRAAAAIGSYVYATGSNLNNGQNLSVKKLVLPAGLPASTQNKILESNFIVFDSFDGARFSVTGKEVFNSTRSSIARTYDTAKIIDKQNNASGQKNAPSKWAPRFIKSGSSNEMTAADGFWGKSASMFASQPFIEGQPSANFVWAQTYGDLAIQPFIQVQNINTSSQSIGSYGASFHLDLYEGLKAVTGYQISDHVLNNGILPDLASTGSSRNFEVGFLKNISSTENLFLRFSDTQIEDLAATDKTFGFKGVKANSWTAGYETQSSLGDFTFGVSRPSQLSSGTISLITPTGRTRSGDVLYKETVFDVSGDDRLERFVAYHYKKDELAISFGVTENSHNHGKVGAAKLDISMQF